MFEETEPNCFDHSLSRKDTICTQHTTGKPIRQKVNFFLSCFNDHKIIVTYTLNTYTVHTQPTHTHRIYVYLIAHWIMFWSLTILWMRNCFLKTILKLLGFNTTIKMIILWVFNFFCLWNISSLNLFFFSQYACCNLQNKIMKCVFYNCNDSSKN